jgi:hypothetical protein
VEARSAEVYVLCTKQLWAGYLPVSFNYNYGFIMGIPLCKLAKATFGLQWRVDAQLKAEMAVDRPGRPTAESEVRCAARSGNDMTVRDEISIEMEYQLRPSV